MDGDSNERKEERMSIRLPAQLRCALAICIIMSAPLLTFGQGSATTGSISGEVIAEADSTPLPGAQVTAVHEPTGTRYVAITRTDGRFSIFNVRVGGPYTVTVNMSGFETAVKTELFARLGDDLFVSFAMKIEAFEAEVDVVASNPIINPTRTGATANVSRESLEALPTLSRSFIDFARTSVYFAAGASNDGQTSFSVAGRNNRYNNIQIDGAVNNDLFGLAATGTPGGQAETEPISLEAIAELQMVVSPYDVRQGGFSGGGINAVTKSGANLFSGSAFYYTRNDSMVGDGTDDIPLGTFENTQYGFSLGGPIVQDKAFFFVSAEAARRDQPAGYSIGGQSGQNWGSEAEAARFRQILLDEYSYDPGGFEEFTRATNSDNLFVRGDFNLANNQQLIFRHNYVDAFNDRGYPSPWTYYMPDNFYQFESETNSTVFQLNSVFGDDYFNEARISYTTVRDNRGGKTRFPQISVELSSGDSIRAGTETYSTANALDQDILEIHDDLTFVRGDHTITIGTHNEFFDFDNLFIRNHFGEYDFRSLDDFERGWAETYDYSFSNTDDPLESAKPSVQQLGFYAGGQWMVARNLTFTYGLRVDIPFFPDKPTRNPASETGFGYRTDVVPDGNILWSPRVGFNWDINGDAKQQLRGDTGIFAGRTPYVWLSNQYSNTGIEFTRISSYINWYDDITETNHITFVADPDNQPTDVGYAATNEIDLIDPDFEFPQVWRTTLGYDRQLGFWGIVGTVELMYSKTLKDILYQNLNVAPTGETTFDGRDVQGNVDYDFRDVILLSNTNKGKQWSAAITFEKPFSDDGIYAKASYIYGRSKSINDGGSSQARSNWRYLYVVDPNNPQLSYSNFDIQHRFVGVFRYRFDLFNLDSNISFYYNAQSGRPYSTTFTHDMNGDYQSNDLFYVPASADEVIIWGGTWDDLNTYIEADDGLRSHRGEIVPRNASRDPWTHSLDFHLGVKVPMKVLNTEVTFDIFNLANLFDSDSGLVRYTSYNEASPVRFRGIDEASGKPIYDLYNVDPKERWSIDDLRSRWQARIGLRLGF
jgi:hypothetical protein